MLYQLPENEYKCSGGFRSKFYANQDILDLALLNTWKFDDAVIIRFRIYGYTTGENKDKTFLDVPN